MTSASRSFDSGLSAAAYLVAALLVVVPLLGLLALLPARPGVATWRLAAEGLFSNMLLLPVVGAALALYVAKGLGHWRTLRTLSALYLVVTVVLVVLLAGFTLDVIQVRRELLVVQARGIVRPGGEFGFDMNIVKSGLELVFAGLVIAVLGWHGWKSLPVPRAAREERRDAAAASLVVAREAAP